MGARSFLRSQEVQMVIPLRALEIEFLDLISERADRFGNDVDRQFRTSPFDCLSFCTVQERQHIWMPDLHKSHFVEGQ